MTRSHKIGWLVIAATLLFVLWRLPRLHGQGFGSFSHDQPYLAGGTANGLPNEIIPYFYGTQAMGMPLTGGQAMTNSDGYTFSVWVYPANHIGSVFDAPAYWYVATSTVYDTNALVGTNHPFVTQNDQSRVQLFNNLALKLNTWNHILCSVGTNNDSALVYINDKFQPLKSDWVTNAIYNWSKASTFNFGRYGFEGGVADAWFDNNYKDLSVEATRRKFIMADGRPASLGTNGATPFGFSPAVFVTGVSDLFATNRGYLGGYFTVTNGPLIDVSKIGRQVSGTNLTTLQSTRFVGNQWLTNGSNLGGTKSSGFTLSFWFKKRWVSGTTKFEPIRWDASDSCGGYISIYTNGAVFCQWYTNGANMVYHKSDYVHEAHDNSYAPVANTEGQYVYGDWYSFTNAVYLETWHHILMACSGSSRRLWIDGYENPFTAQAGVSNCEMLWQTGTLWWIGNGFQESFDCDLADVWMDLQWRDMSDATTRAKFITADRWAANLGADGSIPFGTTPAIYLKGTGLTNAGSGGSFTAYGSPVAAPNGPIQNP